MDSHEALQALGLSEKEVQVYLALLELGESSVSRIAEKAGVKRPTAYVVLGELEEKGFVSHAKHGKQTLYAPAHPEKLLTEAEIRVKELASVMPQLNSLFEKEEGKPRVVIYEGKERLDQANDEIFVAKGDAMYMGTLALSMDVLSRTFRKTDYAALGPDFRIFELIDDSPEGRAYAKRNTGTYRKIRFLPDELLPFQADIGTFGNKVIITSVTKEYFAISIESKEISQAFRGIFNAMWSLSKEPTV